MKWQEDTERSPVVCRKSLSKCPTTRSGGVEVAPFLDHAPVMGETGLIPQCSWPVCGGGWRSVMA